MALSIMRAVPAPTPADAHQLAEKFAFGFFEEAKESPGIVAYRFMHPQHCLGLSFKGRIGGQSYVQLISHTAGSFHSHGGRVQSHHTTSDIFYHIIILRL